MTVLQDCWINMWMCGCICINMRMSQPMLMYTCQLLDIFYADFWEIFYFATISILYIFFIYNIYALVCSGEIYTAQMAVLLTNNVVFLFFFLFLSEWTKKGILHLKCIIHLSVGQYWLQNVWLMLLIIITLWSQEADPMGIHEFGA